MEGQEGFKLHLKKYHVLRFYLLSCISHTCKLVKKTNKDKILLFENPKLRSLVFRIISNFETCLSLFIAFGNKSKIKIFLSYLHG